jgi:hypothetical protein
MGSKPRAAQECSVPTILVIHHLSGTVARAIRQDGFLILTADNADDGLSIIKTHSRPIHLMLIEASTESELLILLAEKHRTSLQFFSIPGEPTPADFLDLAEKVRRLFQDQRNRDSFRLRA